MATQLISVVLAFYNGAKSAKESVCKDCPLGRTFVMTTTLPFASKLGEGNTKVFRNEENDLFKGIDMDSVLIQGYVYVQRAASLWRSQSNMWKLRYAVVADDCVYIFKREKDIEAPSALCEIIQLNGVGIYPEDLGAKTRQRYCLKITKGRRCLTISSSSETERDSWLTALLTVVTRLLVTKTHLPSTPSFDTLKSIRGRGAATLQYQSPFSQRNSYSMEDYTSKDFTARSPTKSATARRIAKATSMLNISDMFKMEHKRKSYILVI